MDTVEELGGTYFYKGYGNSWHSLKKTTVVENFFSGVS